MFMVEMVKEGQRNSWGLITEEKTKWSSATVQLSLLFPCTVQKQLLSYRKELLCVSGTEMEFIAPGYPFNISYCD